VVTVTNHDQELFWESIRLDTVIRNENAWFNFSGIFKFPASITKEAVFKCFLWNINQKNIVVLDDLKIQFEKMDNPTFLPPDDQFEEYIYNEVRTDEVLFSNPFYKIVLDKETNTIAFLSNNFTPLANHLLSYDQLSLNGEEIEESSGFLYKSFNVGKSVSRLKLKARNKYTTKELEIICSEVSPELNFKIKEKYRKNVACKRSAILLKGHQPIEEVIRANRKSDTNNFQQEYWLDKQGAVFGNDDNSITVYHTPGISSLQLDIESNLLVINLDYEKDHPFLHFPLRNDTVDYKLDWSESIYKRQDKRINRFNLFMGVDGSFLPRFMKNPMGYLATYIWTEHADFSNIRTNRATYFGSENIRQAENATSGFIHYNIPVTKSVFYNNPDQITNTEISGGEFTGLESAIVTDTAFHDFLKQIDEHNIEICLHTPEQYTTTMDQLEAALDFTHQQFGSKTWIDHGYNNLKKNNREDFMCDGLLKKTPFYAANLWKKFGVSYFWNAYYEDYFSFEKWRFESLIEPYFSGFGDFMPKPEYWKHPTRSNEFIHWPTSTVLYIENDGLWEYFFSNRNLNAFVDSWSVEMNHCYPAWVDPKKGFWTYDMDSTIVAQPGFNRTLERMSHLKNEKKLNVTTVKDFLNYHLLLENVEYQLLQDGRIRISNNNDKDISGLSFATKARFVLVDRLIPAQKISGDELVFWFDLDAGASRVIRIVK